MTISIKLNDINRKNTETDLLKEPKRKEKIKAFIDNVATNYPTTKERITQFWTDNDAEYKKLKSSSSDNDFLKFWDKFNNEDDIIKLVQPETLKKLDQILLIKDTDNEIIKALKWIYDQKEIKDYINDKQGGVIWQVYILDFVNEIYLTNTEAFLKEGLKENNLDFKRLKNDDYNPIFSELLEGGIASIAFINYPGLSALIDTTNKGLDKLRKYLSDNNKDKKDLKDLLDALGRTSAGVAQAWYKNLILTFNNHFKNITGEIKQLTSDDLDKVKEEMDAIVKATNDKQAELNKVNQQLNDLIKAGTGGAADTIKALQKDKTDLENEVKKLKKDLADAKKATGGGGTTPTIAGTEEWKAVALFLTEPNYHKARRLFSELWSKNWIPEQRTKIYRMLAADKENAHWARDQWPQRFRK